MSCCSAAPAASLSATISDAPLEARIDEIVHASRVTAPREAQCILSSPDIRCGACIATIERTLSALPGVLAARVNLTLRRITLTLERSDPDLAVPDDPLARGTARAVAQALDRIGYGAMPVDLGDLDDLQSDRRSRQLLRALAVAGFAAGNIMLLSVSVWSGAEGTTRDFFHLISALIAIPAVLYAGQPFYRSAISALAKRRLNMDVPISLAVLLALGMSTVEALTGGTETYFDAAAMLLFFLLIGRVLDSRMRDRARSAAVSLSRLAAKSALTIGDDGTLAPIPVDDIRPGMRLRVHAGERIPVDSVILSGASTLDRSLVTGESLPIRAEPGGRVEAGTLNLSGPLDMEAARAAKDSFLAEVLRLMEAAESGRGGYIRIADRMARLYAPAVHLLALVTFIGWLAVNGDWHASLYTAISVLIITCPCALGLAVPVVHVIASGRLFELGILAKDGGALERLAEADVAVFDKTGTVTTGRPRARLPIGLGPDERALARALALNSAHPAAIAVADALTGTAPARLGPVSENVGYGVSAVIDTGAGAREIRLGRRGWVAAIALATAGTPREDRDEDASAVAFAMAGGPLWIIGLEETLRPGAAETMQRLTRLGLPVELLSGDTPAAAAAVARRLGIDRSTGAQTPTGKLARLQMLKSQGHRVLMIGDGLNDAPSLAAGHVSIAPGSASDAGRLAADFIFTRERLSAVATALTVARKARTLIRQNFGLALAYNLVAVPLSMLGHVTPLVAAIAMSASSILVVANSLRLTAKPEPESELAGGMAEVSGGSTRSSVREQVA